MKGKGCAGSTASGVSTGKTRSWKKASSQAMSASPSSSASSTARPAGRSRWRSVRQASCWPSVSVSARWWMAASCCVAESPSGDGVVMPSRSWPTRPATRTE